MEHVVDVEAGGTRGKGRPVSDGLPAGPGRERFDIVELPVEVAEEDRGRGHPVGGGEQGVELRAVVPVP